METCCSRFTAAEGGARLASVASIKNTIITEHCTFVATRLLHEDAYKIRGLLSEGRQRSIFLTRSSRIAYVAYELGILTDLTIAKIVNYEDVTDWKEHVEVNEVIVCTSRILKCILEDGYLSMPDINVLVIDSCHLISTDDDLKYVMRLYKECTEKNKPRLLALTYPIFTSINNINEATNNDEINRENKSDIKQIENNQTSLEKFDLANEIEEINTDKIDFVQSDSSVIDKTIDEIDNDSTIDKNDVELKDKVIQHSIEKTDDESVLDIESSRNLDRTVACITEKGFESIKDKCKDTKDILGVYKNVDDFEMYEKLGWKIEELEKELDCEMDLAEDIDGGKRLLATITKPKEVIIEYSKQLSLENLPEVYKELDLFMRNTIQDGIDFIKEHRYDPSEIYGEELYEEFINIPDPTKEPKEIFAQFLYILDELGPYAADKAAFCLLAKLEKLKIKVPYERHFLLLCMCTTILVKIRGYADYVFSKYNSDWEMIKLFCTPKVLRLTEILEQFRPMASEKETNSPTNEMDCIINETNRTITGDVKNETDYKNETDHKINETNRSINETGDVRNEIDLAKNKSDCNYETDHIINETNRTINETGDEKNKIHLVKIESDCKNETDHKINEMNRKISEAGDVKNEFDLVKEETGCKNESNNKTNESELARNENNLIINETDHKVNETNQTINETGDVKNESDCKKEKNEIELAKNETIPMVNETDHLINQTDHEINETNRIINKTSDVKNEIHLAKDINCKIESNNKVNKTELARNETMPVINETDYKINETNRTINEKDCKSNEIDNKNEINTSKTKQMLNIIENCDFTSLGNKIEDRVNTYESNLKELEVYSAGDKNISDIKVKDEIKSVKGRQRVRGRPRVIKNNSVRVLQNQNPDALCGIMFLREPLMAKILFMLLVDISRCKQSLSYICAQYCAVEVAGELQECQRQSRKQEDVLKKFRMHECNLLLATPILEEGIDLPRCNLVLRWDVPPSYRSHALCRGRARAPRSALALLAESPRHSRLLLHHLAIYRELDQIVTRKCGCGIQDEPTSEEESYADEFTAIVKSYSPMETKMTEIVVTPKNNTNVEDKEGNQDSKESDVKNGNVTESDGIAKKVIKDRLERDGDININETERDRVNGNIKIKMLEADTVKSEITSDLGNEISENTNKDKVDSDSNLVDSEVIERTVKKSDSDNIASVDLSTAIALINRYCGKLPSDTFTRLAPQWWMEEVQLPDKEGYMKTGYICTLRLPLNCPVKYNIVGHPMPTRVLARRMVALQACRILHKSGELDNQLMPIGKENFKAVELEGAGSNANGVEPVDPNDSARPGTTKRRQYYYKRTAWAFTDCQPIVDTTDEEIESADYDATKRQYKPGEKRNTLYAIDSRLWCALPERYNTRGRRLHAPQHARQAIGILMARHRPDKLQIPAFPVYTRSGEVRVSVELAEEADVRLSPRRARLVRRFMRFVFSDVLRVRRRGMKLQNEGSTHNNYYIVPTVKTINEDGTSKVDIDWSFLELIFKHTEEKRNLEVEKPIFFQQDEEEIEEKKVDSRGKGKDGKVKKMDNPLLKEGETFTFDPEKYKEAVVTPWYRNQDQPQFFLVAEICWNLSPDSAFPSATHTTFRDYYSNKYGVTLTQPNQPLLDVDHTSARLNLLTPRYVNRKGVALPVSSERTRRAKRDRLDQKQILVPELCRVHPFAAPLWFATVALPCVLYRINALLIADEIRRAVAIDVGLGIPKIDDTTCPGFQWPPLDFGWSLAEVFSADSDKGEKKKDYDEDDLSEKEKDFLAIEESKEENLESDSEEVKKTINDILQEKEDAETCFEIGTWSNDMASSIQETVDFDEYLEPLPSNLTFCTSASGGANWNCPIEKPKQYANRTFSVADSDCSYLSSDFDTDDTEMNSEGSDEDTDASGFCSSKNSNAAMGVRIEYKTAHEAEAVDVERTRRGPPPPQPCARDDARDLRTHTRCLRDVHPPPQYIEKFRESVKQHEKDIIDNELLIDKDKPIIDLLSDTSKDIEKKTIKSIKNIDISELFPYTNDDIVLENGQITIDSIEKNKRRLLEGIKKNLLLEDKMNCFSMKDVNIDSPDYVNEKLVNVGFDSKVNYKEKVNKWKQNDLRPYYQDVKVQDGFDFDYQPVLDGHPGPSPSVILQALTMSNANDGINLERLETIGDSFLKFAITAYLYCAHPTVHEGKLSHMRSKQVSNLNLYRLGRGKRLGARMTASKFEPHDNWLPPCHRAPPTLHHKQPEVQEQATGEVAVDNAGCFIPYNLITQHSIPDKSIADCVEALIGAYLLECGPRGALLFMSWLGIRVLPRHDIQIDDNHPYVVGHKDENAPVVVEKSPSPPTKRQQRTSESDSDFDDEDDESGDQIQLEHGVEDWSWSGRAVGSLKPYKKNGIWYQPIFGELRAPPSPLLRYIEDPEGELEQMLSGYEALEQTLQYRFKDRSLLLQALTHASHHKNRLTDCYQRLEFLGDAILDYLITRHLYEDARRHSPGALTDLRSALVNNTIFATLAARHGFHKYFRHMSPGLNDVLTKYVKIQEENGHSISEEHYLIHEDEMEQAEDVEVPKALGDLFESIAGAIFLDSGMSLGAVWRSYVRLMGAELEAFSAAAPKSPVRELLEAEPDTAKFGKPERLADGRRVRVCVEVFGRGAFKGVGRNYRIAKGTAARCALRHLKTHAAA